MSNSRLRPSRGRNAATGVLCRGYAEKKGLGLAPQVGLEPTTLRLTAECSTIELLRSSSWINYITTKGCHQVNSPYLLRCTTMGVCNMTVTSREFSFGGMKPSVVVRVAKGGYMPDSLVDLERR